MYPSMPIAYHILVQVWKLYEPVENIHEKQHYVHVK